MKAFDILGRSRASLAVCALVVCTLTAANAATYTVNALTDSAPTAGGAGSGTAGDLRYCVVKSNTAGGSNTITFGVTGTIRLSGYELAINNNLTIIGPGSGSLTVDANHASRHFFIVRGRTVAMSGLKLINGNGSGNDSTGLDSYRYGGGASILNYGSNLTLTDLIVSNNTISSSSGAIYNLAEELDVTPTSATLTMTNCTVSNNSTTGIYNDGSNTSGAATLTVTNSTITGNSTTGAGGGIYSTNPLGTATSAVVIVDSSTISSNSAGSGSSGGGIDSGNLLTVRNNSTISGNTAGSGGGIYNRATATISDSVISDNTARGGGGIDNGGETRVVKLTLQNCTITRNRAAQDSYPYGIGGGILNDGVRGYGTGTNSATLEITNCTISANTSNGYGAGMWNYGYGSARIASSTFSGNVSDKDGGAIANGMATTMIGCAISGNTASTGNGGGILNDNQGGAFNAQGALTMVNSSVTGNTAGGAGGGISDAIGTVTLSSSAVSGNSATGSGGGIYHSGPLTISGSTIGSNTSNASGGGVYNDHSTFTAGNSTIARNSATTSGGGIYNAGTNGSSTVILTNVTLAGNSAAAGGGIFNNSYFFGNPRLTMGSTILALNTPGGNYADEGPGSFGNGPHDTSNGYNLVDDSTCNAFLVATGDKKNTASGLQVDGTGKPLLQDNGGMTQTTALLAGSAAIDAGKATNDPLTGSPLTTDQRGFVRPFDVAGTANATGGDGSDVGAFESGGAPVISVSASPASGGTAVGGGTFATGTNVTVTAAPNAGYVFINWTEGGAEVSTSANYTFTATGGRTLVASFLARIPPTIVIEQPAGTPLTSGSGTNYGTVFLGSNLSKIFTLRNSGELNLTIGTITIDGSHSGDFSINPGPTSPLSPSGSTTFTVTFAPGGTGARNAVLHIPSNDPGTATFNLNLAGEGSVSALAQVTSPTPGSTLASGTTMFNWDAGSGVTGYALWIGSTAGGYDIYSGIEGTNLSKTVTTLPNDGRTLYVTLYSLINGSYQSNAYTYTAYRTPQPQGARLTSPANGSSLSTPSLPLVWNAGVGVTGYVLWAGTVAGGYDLYAAVETGTSRTINVPADKRIYVTLWSLISGSYHANYYFFDPVPSSKAVLVSPAGGSTLVGSTLALTWNAGVGASTYALWLGSSPGGYDLGAASAGTATTWTFNNVPRDGGPVYLTLWSLINGAWQSNSYWFTTALPVGGNRGAILTSPANASALGSATLNLTWDAGVGATSYALWVGSTPNGYDLYAALEAGTSRSVPVPGDGRRIYVTLWSLIGGTYQSNAYYFTAPTLPDAGAAQVTSPFFGSTLTDATLPLTWSSAAGATQYYLFVGTSPGAYDLYIGSQGTSLFRTVTGMPLDGRPVYVTLYSWLNNTWKPSSAWFTTANTASGNKRALITSPANATTLPGASTTFSWGGGVGASQYAMWIGSSPGAYDLWASAEGTATSRTTTLPTDGRKLYVTLYSMIGGIWQAASYQYTAANVAITKATITSPAPGSALPGTSAAFVWSASNTATAYALWIGRAPGGYDVYAGAAGGYLSRTVTTLPMDGAPIYATVWSLINGTWQSTEAIYQTNAP